MRSLQNFQDTSSGKLSILYKGNIHLRLGEFEEAIKAYESFLQKGRERKTLPDHSPWKVSVIPMKGKKIMKRH